MNIGFPSMPAFEAAAARIGAWWGGLSRREQWMVGMLGVVLGMVVLFYGVLRPIHAAREQAWDDIRTYETLNARIRAAGGLVRPGGQAQQRSGTPAVIVAQSASSRGIAVQVAPMDGGVRGTVSDAPYDVVLGWIADVGTTSTLRPARVSITRGTAQGHVAAVVEFAQ